jgi:aminoglycoside phosphotransferase (APT) family kinase protein
LEELAKLHACGWQAPYVPTLTAWPGVIRETMDHLLTAEYWEPMLDRELADVVPAALRDAQRVKAALLQMWSAFEGSHRCLIHGDAHLGNIYFEAETRPGFLDWQSPMAGPCFDDVTYCLIGSLSIEDRRAHERELLRHYLDQLAHNGVASPSFDTTWHAYRQQVMHGFMWVSTPPSMQPDDIVAANVERFCVALEDLETLQALAA